MYKKFTLIAVFVVAAAAGLQAQTNRFIDSIYSVGAPTLDTFARNIDVFQLTRALDGDPNAKPNRHLEMDVYQPEGDDDLGLRPVVVVFHTGNFLPQYVNQGLYGTRKDSAVVEITSRVASLGYVGIAADYRVGWNPVSPDQDVRTGTLLEAAYRGGQDAHTLARYLRKSVAEEGNPYRIDTTRIVFWGLGTGGYVTLTHAFLDRIAEVAADARFYNQADQVYVNLENNADPQGLQGSVFAGTESPSNIPNHVGYSSDVAMTVNSNGALGDIDWMEGKDNEPITIGFHSPADIFAPFSYGDVIVPTNRNLVIGCVAGTEQILEKANMLGLNDTISEANSVSLDARFGPLAQAVNVRNETYKGMTRTLDPVPACPDQSFDPTYELSHDNMYPFIDQGLGAPYNWVDGDDARARIGAYNAAGGELNADVALGSEQLTNPNAFNPAAAKRVIDTMMAVFIPRAYFGLNLDAVVSTENLLTKAQIGLNVFPNPATTGFTIEVADEHLIRQLDVFDLTGRRVTQVRNINRATYNFERGELPNGPYVLQLRFDEGTAAQKVFLR